MSFHVDAKTLTNKTLETYGAVASNIYFGSHNEWTFVVRHCGKNVFGLCNLVKKEIILDPRVMEHGTWGDIKEVVLHECAHALAGLELTASKKNVMAHGKLWRSWAKRLGCSPRAKLTRSDTLMQEYYTAQTNTKKYKIISVIDNKVTVHGYAGRKLKNLKNRHYPSVKNSLGNLYLIETSLYEKAKTVDDIQQYAFQ